MYKINMCVVHSPYFCYVFSIHGIYSIWFMVFACFFCMHTKHWTISNFFVLVFFHVFVFYCVCEFSSRKPKNFFSFACIFCEIGIRIAFPIQNVSYRRICLVWLLYYVCRHRYHLEWKTTPLVNSYREFSCLLGMVSNEKMCIYVICFFFSNKFVVSVIRSFRQAQNTWIIHHSVRINEIVWNIHMHRMYRTLLKNTSTGEITHQKARQKQAKPTI